MVKAKKKKKKAAAKKARGIKGKLGLTVCQTWIKCFEDKGIKTAADCSAAMKKEFPGRVSEIFNHPQVVIGRANRGLLDGKKHNYKKYPADGEATKKKTKKKAS